MIQVVHDYVRLGLKLKFFNKNGVILLFCTCIRVVLSDKGSYSTHYNFILSFYLQHSSTIGGKQVFDLLPIVQ